MSKQTGIGARLFVDEYDISGDTGAIDSISMSRAQLDVTGLDKEFMERLPGLGDAGISFTGFFNQPNAHTQLSPMGTAAQIVTAAMKGDAGAAAASISAAEVSYNVTRSVGGAIATNSEFTSFAGYGVEWGVMLTAGTVSATGTGSAVDGLASSASGGAAYVHIFSVTSGTATVTIENSSTGTSSWTAIGTATAAAAGTAERVALTGTIARYTRYNISGGTAVIAVSLHRT